MPDRVRARSARPAGAGTPADLGPGHTAPCRGRVTGWGWALVVLLVGSATAGARAEVTVAAPKLAGPSPARPSRREARAQRTHRRSKAPTAIEHTGIAPRYGLYEAELAEAARVYQLPRALLRAVARVESDFRHDALSAKGAVGLMQIIPGTARSMGVTNPHDPRQNILGGARYLRVLANRWRGDLVLVIASYNAGPEAVRRYGGIPPYRETQGYVQRVLRHYHAYAAGQMLPSR